ncbi:MULTISPECIES: tryptophan-rich sensory protein [Halanaerobium]|jgi:hypothetical protein|uniref:TspO and MBR related proteins n=1 Tax=Halanaerobium kushneri TaxID=56779 RepID=A0A1N6Z5H8_9FIRM|nr:MULTISPECIES: tryptophan-rich sensory protein [Halanaerobium]RCW62324.1 hypothetical protein DFR80_101126 [Halanaerobium sp. ST460_2HS_T2]SIR22088.1 hypothetical protein SAMN05421834_11662 [Halanaerobium kushneri]
MAKNKIGLKIVNLVFLLLTIFVNFLANYLPINGVTSGEVSALYQNPFTPAGFTFSIWGVIYTLLIIFIIYQFLGQSEINKNFSTGPYFIIASLANMSWLYLWHHKQIPLSMIIILLLPFSLFKIFKRLHQHQQYQRAEYLGLKLPFSIYTAWVTIASIANFMALLVYFNDNWPANFLSIAAIIGILIGLFIAVKILDKYKNIPFALVFIWALTGIIGAQLGYENSNMAVVITAGVSIIIILFKMINAFGTKTES